jgi:hypothetical protein
MMSSLHTFIKRTGYKSLGGKPLKEFCEEESSSYNLYKELWKCIKDETLSVGYIRYRDVPVLIVYEVASPPDGAFTINIEKEEDLFGNIAYKVSEIQ